MAEEKTNGSKIFGFSVRDFVILFTLFAGLFLGNNLITGTPNTAKKDISSQIDGFKADVMEELESHRGEMKTNADGIRDLERKYEDLSRRMDSLYNTLTNGLRNLDRYHQEPAQGDGR